MVRKLPWKRSTEEADTLPPSTPKTETPRRKPTPSSTIITPTPRERAQEGISRIRSPSTSPPPEPPTQEFIIPSDDKYRMVEDELLHTARRFTTHLHRAEYNRLKQLTKVQNAATIREIERPVVPGVSTSRAKRRKEAASRIAKQSTLLEEKDMPWVGTSLQGLMDTPKGEVSSIQALGGGGTRAAAGFGASLGDGEGRGTLGRGGEEGGLTSRVRGPVTPRPRPGEGESLYSATPAYGSSRSVRAREVEASGGRGVALRSSGGDEGQGGGREDDGIEEEGDEDDPFGVNKRRVRREKSRDQMRKGVDKETPKKLSHDTIPSFF